MRLGPTVDAPWPASLSDPTTGWAQLRWSQRISPGALKPTVQPLAQAVPVTSGAPYPIVTRPAP